MRLTLLLLLISLSIVAYPATAQTATGLRIVVVDGRDHPVAGLTITLLTEDGSSQRLTTDEAGIAVAAQLSGTAFRLSDAQLNGGVALSIEGTTIDQGLRLGLVPGQQRTVLLRTDAGLLFVDPETLFAGPAVPPTVATLQAAATSSGATAAANGRALGSVTQLASASATRRSRWPFALAMLLLVAVPLALLSLRALFRAYIHKREQR